MKVLNIIGSPRKKGTSARIANSFVETARAQGAEVVEYYLNGMTLKGCQGCEVCHSKQTHCVLKDDLKPVLDAMREAEVTVFSSPVYYGDTSAQFKMLMDRTWSHVEIDYSKDFPFSSRLPKGSKALFILSQGDVAEKHQDIVERYSQFLELYGYEYKFLRVVAQDGSPDADVSALQQQASDIAEEFLAAK